MEGGLSAAAGADALLAIIDDLSARLAAVERVVHDGTVTAESVTAQLVEASLVVAEQVDVWIPTDDAPVVTMDARHRQVRVGNGQQRGPHVDIEVGPPGYVGVDGRPVPDLAGIYLCADEDVTGVQLEASVDHPDRQSLGQLTVLRPGLWPAYRSVEIADEILCRRLTVAEEQGGEVVLGAGDMFAELRVAAGHDETAPAVLVHSGTEEVDERGRDVADSWVSVLHQDEHVVRLGCSASAERAGVGALKLLEGGTERIAATVRSGQAVIDLLSPSGDGVSVDAGPDGAAVAIYRGDAPRDPVWLDGSGLRRMIDV